MNINWTQPITVYELIAIALSTIALIIPLIKYIYNHFIKTTLIISKKPGNTGISRDIRTEFTTDLLLSD